MIIPSGGVVQRTVHFGDPFQDHMDIETLDALKEKAAASIPQVLEMRDQKLADLEAAHEQDIEHYTFECERFGDFLLLKLSRSGRRYATSVNLSKISEIRVVEGRPPNMDGCVTFNYSCAGDNKFDVQPNWDEPRHSDRLVRLCGTDEHSPYRRLMSGSTLPGLRIDDCPRAAADDEMILVGFGTIYMPAGLGEEMHRRVLQEMRRWGPAEINRLGGDQQ